MSDFYPIRLRETGHAPWRV